MKNRRSMTFRPFLIAGVLAVPVLLGGCGGSSHRSSTASSDGTPAVGSIISEKGTVTAVQDPIQGASSTDYLYVIKGNSGRVYEDVSLSLTADFRQNGLRVAFTATVVAAGNAPGADPLGITIQITKITKI